MFSSVLNIKIKTIIIHSPDTSLGYKFLKFLKLYCQTNLQLQDGNRNLIAYGYADTKLHFLLALLVSLLKTVEVLVLNGLR